ncbi:MAG: hypothetical protein SF172_08745 [Burkholderiales bacterium]|nr:hypothetical protein [Burkholderiales bacterium]
MSLGIAERADRLVAAFEAKGLEVSANLRPGLSREDIIKATAAVGLTVPPEVIELYQWRDGHVDEFAEACIQFRDNTFLSLERALEEYEWLTELSSDDDADDFGVDLRTCLPIAAFDGALYVVACGQHGFGADKPHPVISSFEGVELYFHSVSAMLDTSIDWVSHPAWPDFGDAAEDVEMDIWKRHNPGIFED